MNFFKNINLFDIINFNIMLLIILTLYNKPELTSKAYIVFLIQFNFYMLAFIVLSSASIIYSKIKDK